MSLNVQALIDRLFSHLFERFNVTWSVLGRPQLAAERAPTRRHY